MPSLTLDDRLIWFAHCPKAGGTSIETLLVNTWADQVGHLRWGWDLWWKRGGWREASPPCSPQHLVWRDAEQILPTAPDLVFALVRDPATRMMSEYRYQRRYRRGTWAGRAFALLPFPIWIRVMLAVAQRNPYAFDNHLRPQSDFIPVHARVFRLEDGIGPVVDWLGQVTQTGDLAVPPQMLKTAPGPRPALGTLALIGAVFAEDYARFGYTTPTPPALPRRALDRLVTCVARGVVALERRGLL